MGELDGEDAERGTVHSTRNASWDEVNALRAWAKKLRVCFVDMASGCMSEVDVGCWMMLEAHMKMHMEMHVDVNLDYQPPCCNTTHITERAPS